MADPKIKYDIEAAVKGDADADRLAKALREVGDVLEGDLQQSALDAAQALEALGSKQRALSAFGALKRETQDLSSQLDKAVGSVDRLGAELQEAAGKTQTLSVAERSTSASVTEAQAALQRKREALRAVREETTSAQRRSDEYRATVAGLKDGIKAATEEVKAQQVAQRTAAQASTTAQNAEAALRKEYDLAIGSAARLSTELRTKNAALAGAREAMQSVGVSTSNLAQQERNLQGAVQQVRAEVATMVPAYQQAAAASSQSTQVQAANQRTLRDSMASISTQLQRIQQIAAVAVGGGYFAGLLKDVAATADEFRNLEARVKLATGEGPLFARSFAGVQTIALATNSALEETGTLFARLTKAAQEGGASAAAAQQRALGLTQTINQAIQLSGGSADAAKAAITQLIQGLQSGVLRGEEFNSVMEQAPRLAQALANGLGVTTGELRRMAEQGALTSETVMKALEGQADAVAGEFGKLPPTVGRALQNLSTQWTLYVGQADKGLISSQNAAKVINTLAQNLDVVVSTLTAAGKAWAAIKIAGLVADFARWATTTVTATAAIEANTIAAVANTSAQRANAAAQAEHAAAQAANTAATTANTAARAANAKAWGEVGAFTRAAGAAQDVATASVARGTAAVAANASSVAQAGVVWRAASGLFGPWGIAVAALTPEILNLSRGLGEQAAKWMGWGKVVEEAEQKLRMADEISKMHAESMRRQAVAYEEAKSRSLDLTKQSAGLIAEFDKLVKAGDSTTEALGKIGKDFDITKSSGIRDMSAALDKLLADAKITATEFQGAWAKALDGQDLAKFEVNARAAFMSAGREAEKLQQQITTAIQSGASEEVVRGLRLRLEGALSAARRESERVAQTMDVILRAAVERTGVEFSVLQGRIGDASRSALNDLDVVIGGLDRLKAQGIDAGRALEASFVKAINTADTQAAIDAVKSKVEQLRARLGDRVADGLLDQARQKALDLGDALDKARPGIQGLREAMVQLGVTSDASLKQTAITAKQAYDAMLASGKASARELGEGFQKAATAAIEANNGIPPSWVTAQAAVRGYRIDVDAAGKAAVVSMKDAQRATEGAGAAARAAAGDYRSMGDQAQYASAQARALAAAGQQLAASFAQRSADVSDSSITKTQGTTNPVDQVPTFNSRAEAEAWKAEWLRQYARDNMATGGGGMLGNYMRDLVMFEYQKELDALSIREAMEAAKKRAEAGSGSAPSTGTGGGAGGGAGGAGSGSSGGGAGGSGSGGQAIDRIVNIYIGNSVAYSVPTTAIGQQNIEALAREVLRVFEQQKAAAGI